MLKQLPVGSMANFCYITGADASSRAVVVDSGWDVPAITAALKELKRTPEAILLTHGHFDHVRASVELGRKFGIPVYIHEADAAMMETFPDQLVKVSSGQEVQFAGLTFKFINTPGHTPGSCCILAGSSLFTGDTLFVEEVGRVDLPGSNPEQMYESLLSLAKLPHETAVYPGHAYGPRASSTIGDELLHNPYLKLAVKGKGYFMEAMA